MIRLPPERVGPYVRALYAALHTLAPNDSFVPLASAADHLRALDPALSGDVLFPAQVDPRTGMPSYPWMQRAASERQLALEGQEEPTDARVDHAVALDPVLGGRLRARRELRRHLRRAVLLPASALSVAVRRLGTSTDFRLTFDRQTPLGLWSRVVVEVSAPGGGRDVGPLHVTPEGRAWAEPGVHHLLARYSLVPILSLRSQLAEGIGARVARVSRSRVGPFWFPGVELPEAVPPALGEGLVLNLSLEVVGDDVRQSADLDPLSPPQEGRLPDGYGHYASRRFAASPAMVPVVRAWLSVSDTRCEVVPIKSAAG